MDNLIKNPILLKNINYDKINIKKIDIENENRKNIILNYDNNYFILETPKLLISNDNIKEYENYYEILIFLKKNDELNEQFIDCLKKIDEKLKLIMLDNKKLFNYKKKIKYKSILRKDIDYYIKIKILKEEIPKLKIIQNNKDFNFKDLNKNNNNLLKLILNFNAIWINKNIFGVYIKPVYIEKIILNDNNISSYETIEDFELDSSIDYSYSNTSLSDKHDINKKFNNEKILISNINSISKNIKELNDNNNLSTTSVTISSIKKKFNKLDSIQEKISYSSTSS